MTHAIEPAARRLLFMAIAATVVGCEGVLEVQDPDRYTSEDLDEALDAVAAGVEGDLHDVLDHYVIYTALMSDVYTHTGTWIGYDDHDHGRITYGNASGGGGGGGADGVMAELLRVRWFAQDAADRIGRVLEAQAASSPIMAQVQSVEAWTNLLLAQGWCEAPAAADGPAVPDTEIYQLALDEFDDALVYAEASGEDEWITFNLAGRARTNLMLGNLDEALADARAVPDGFVKAALYSLTQENALVNLTTTGFNNAAGMRPKWWSMVDTAADYLIDPYTGALDTRVPIRYSPGALGVDGRTAHYSQFKLEDRASDIPITHSDEMHLIEAEVHWRNGDHDLAIAVLDELRAAVGLDPLAPSTDPDTVRDYLLHERFAELFMEGHRMNDLHRFGLVGQLLADGAYGAESTSPRPTKFPLSEDEGRDNSNIEDDVSQRCLPMSS